MLLLPLLLPLLLVVEIMIPPQWLLVLVIGKAGAVTPDDLGARGLRAARGQTPTRHPVSPGRQGRVHPARVPAEGCLEILKVVVWM